MRVHIKEKKQNSASNAQEQNVNRDKSCQITIIFSLSHFSLLFFSFFFDVAAMKALFVGQLTLSRTREEEARKREEETQKLLKELLFLR